MVFSYYIGVSNDEFVVVPYYIGVSNDEIVAFSCYICLSNDDPTFVSNYFIGTCALACCTWCSMRWGAPPHAAYMQQAWRVACCIYAGTIIAQNIYYDFQCN